MNFKPDYNNLVDAAYNRVPVRLPLYEHGIDCAIMEKLLGITFAHLRDGSKESKDMFFASYCRFFYEMGYDTVTFEGCIGPAMPGSGALGGHKPGVIFDRNSFERYPWDRVESAYFEQYSEDFESLRRNMPPGMKAVGGVGNGIFECVQDVVGYMQLCYIKEDDELLYADLFKKVGEINLSIWKRFLNEYGDIFCVCRFGDDLGFKSATLLSPQDIKEHIIPQYKAIISEVHRHGKPFLLHSCGCIFDVMEDMLESGIDAKHSNEDQIAPFEEWVERYGQSIGNFGGIDTDAVCRLPKAKMEQYIYRVLERSWGQGGIAFGSGNSIPDYVPAEQYRDMINIVRQWRGDFEKERKMDNA